MRAAGRPPSYAGREGGRHVRADRARRGTDRAAEREPKRTGSDARRRTESDARRPLRGPGAAGGGRDRPAAPGGRGGGRAAGGAGPALTASRGR
ncbi:hypothetical protein FE374_18490 [Georgenia yuyongxinii]|uniref:Uncharacterized protein n=1 Tax=Georgenia yuyongxinii TaxID=2589797 RepID=A0A5B8C6W7_9MICO|nr:hypothetical protein FE374_18490 [Georgenia yuyongxinii]